MHLTASKRMGGHFGCCGAWSQLTGLQVADFQRQFTRRDVIGGHQPLGAATAPVLNAEGRDGRAAVGSGDPGDVDGALSRHGDGGTVWSLGHWAERKVGTV